MSTVLIQLCGLQEAGRGVLKVTQPGLVDTDPECPSQLPPVLAGAHHADKAAQAGSQLGVLSCETPSVTIPLIEAAPACQTG